MLNHNTINLFEKDLKSLLKILSMKKLAYIFQVFYKWQEKVPMKNENKLIVSLF